jgi:outer membrane usher protein
MGSAPRSRSRWTDALRVVTVALAALIASPQARGAEPPDPAPAVAGTQELLVEIDVNGLRVGAAAIAIGAGRRVFVPEADYRRLRLRPPPTAAIVTLDGERAVALDAIAPVSYTLDERKLTLSVTAPPEAFEISDFDAARRAAPKLSPTAPGAFLNYDAAAERSGGFNRYGGLLELGVFGDYGVGLASAVARDDGTNRDVVRLETSWVKDFPERLATLRMGDAIGVPGAWGRAVRFGGVQFGTNFATQPYLVRFPLQTISGEAALPSTVDLLVNGVPTATQSVPSGPFRISDVPTITGAGEIRVVVRDVLGREQVTVLPYYTPQALLRQGLADYAVEAGKIRRNFGIESNDYGRAFGVGTYRYGFTDAFTAEARGEYVASGDGVAGSAGSAGTLGLGGAYLVGDFGVATAAAAASNSDRGTGALYSLGFFRQGRVVTFGAQTTLTTSRFTQLGLPENVPAPRNVTLASVGVNTGRTGSVAFGYGLADDRQEPRREIYTLSYSLSFGRWGSLFASASETRTDGGSTRALFLTYTIALGPLTSASVAWTRPGGGADPELVGTLQRSPPLGEGFGYLLQATDAGRGFANGTVKTRYGDAFAEARYGDGETAYRGGVVGSVVALGGSVFATRPMTSSFAVIEVPDFPNVRVYQDNQLVGRTSEAGTLLLPTLRPYEANPVRVDQRDLPLGARVDALEVQAVPGFRSGVLVKFPVGRSYGAVMKVERADGKPPPAGAAARIDDAGRPFIVAPDGELFLSGLTKAARIVVRWRDGACEFRLDAITGDDPLPDLGTRFCREPVQ